jgi:hypothetical protein
MKSITSQSFMNCLLYPEGEWAMNEEFQGIPEV